MAATHWLKHPIPQPHLQTARSEFDVPEVWPDELGVLLHQAENLKKVVTNFSKPFHQNDR